MKKLDSQKPAYVFNVVLVGLLVSQFFVFPLSLACPQVGKYIEVGVFCRDTQCPVPAGLAVTVTGNGFKETLYTDGSGYAGLFGSGLVDGEYTISFWWNGEYTDTVTIDCSQIVWTFDYVVPNPVIIKHFVYDLEGYPPVVGLNVDLVDASGTVVASSVTDGTGTVVFDGTVVAAETSYWLQWLWGSVVQQEGAIVFPYVNGQLLGNVIELTNYLSPKTCGK